MKNTETKWTKLISVRVDKEIIEYFNKSKCEDFNYHITLSGKINYILKKYIKEKEEEEI